ncbi:hypothetical protein [Puia dinghuensis]|uniref:Uncharacterized protein n=1 Tax=Puia dinghuensis TaxID=1792502 RepID=A0A8J2XVZ0_9BACT|nr:hypothetical protein [Puia dinghuensis]GGB20147.1 hypothetical protein GCM10011511_49860 [Puia dinghuensis]
MKELAITLEQLLQPLRSDERVGPVHVCVYLALLQCGGGRKGWFHIQRDEVMRLAKIKGRRTYYRVMGELAEIGFVEYWASRNGKSGSRVRMGS